MQFVEPKVFMIAETTLHKENLQNFLMCIGVPTWDTNATSDAEKLIEVAGKTCYKSFHPDLNKNLSSVRNNQNRNYIQEGLIKANHGSVLEHASVTFAICNVSRVFTHELVRHRAGCSFSQESGRYVRTDELKAYKPSCLDDEELTKLELALSQIEIMYKDIEHYVFKRIGNDFKSKKEVTSALRRILPEGRVNNIIFTANHRALRHIIELRTSPHAEEEIKEVFTRIAYILKYYYPNIYEDLVVDVEC